MKTDSPNISRSGPRKQGDDIRLLKCPCGASYWQVGPVTAVCPWIRRHP
jgi:hypothetical protein